ncbi:MAG: metallophosphoesterase family protein, partial [candidate division Zixibacteria bacterium]|nr:metallophosphoesterase family protein [candidate division Zixibacteria bacterium]
MAVLSDVHANLEALEAVAADLDRQRVEKIMFLGDVIGYGADPNACVKLIARLCDIRLMGNHDYVGLGLESPQYFNVMAQQSILWTQKELDRKATELMSDFTLEAEFLNYYFVHATPENPLEWNYLLTPEDAVRNFAAFAQDFCFVGHSHLPAVFCLRPDGCLTMVRETSFHAETDCRYIINVGSVGQPRDGDARAAYVILDTETRSITHYRVAY